MSVENSDQSVQIVAYMTSWCPDCVDAHKALTRSGLAFSMIDVESVPGAEEAMREAAGGIRKVPTIIIEGIGGRQVLIEPDNASLAEALRAVKIAAAHP